MSEKPLITIDPLTTKGPDYLTPKMVVERVPITLRELGEAGRRGTLPRIKLSNKRTLYYWPDVKKALAGLTVNPIKDED